MNVFTFYLTGQKDADSMFRLRLDRNCLIFRLPYTPPYEKFPGIRAFQAAARFHPFQDEAVRARTAVVDLREWLGHEQEEYLEIFMKFLHDYRNFSFYDFSWVLTAGSADRAAVRDLFLLASCFLGRGRLEEDRLLTDSVQLAQYIAAAYPLQAAAARRCGEILTRNRIASLTQADAILSDLCESCGGRKREKKLSAEQIFRTDAVHDTLFWLFYEPDLRSWMEELQVKPDSRTKDEEAA